MNLNYSFRVKAGLILLVLLSLISNVSLLKQTVKLPLKSPGNDEIILFEKRFEQLKMILPKEAVCGYISDKEGLEAIRSYYLTQYTLSPAIIVDNTNYRFIIGDFRDLTTGTIISEEHNLIIMRDFGNGVILLINDAK
jgi:hypothetical protein